jgi:hypothetical protein
MKKITLIVLFLLSAFGYSQTEVGGVVTYYFNKYQGNKPDLGATVVLIDSAKVKGFDYKLYENFHYGSFYSNMYMLAQERYDKYSKSFKATEGKKKHAVENETFKKGMDDATKDMLGYKNQMVLYNFDSNEKSAKICVDLYMQLTQLSEDLPSKTVDANGNYKLSIVPGTYYVYIKSKNRTSVKNIAENSGKIYIKKVKIIENQSKDVSYNFEL